MLRGGISLYTHTHNLQQPHSRSNTKKCETSFCGGSTNPISYIGPPIRQENPLNLSILLSGGKETNQDSLSNGE